EVSFPLTVPAAQSATFSLDAITDQADLKDALEQTVAVRPWGVEQVATAGGVAQGDRSVEVKLPDGKYLSRRLAITVGPNVPTTRPSDLRVSGDVVSGLAQAKQLGFGVPGPAMAKALAWLQTRFQQTGAGDNAAKALILYAQSVAGAADFAFLNRLHRLRASL